MSFPKGQFGFSFPRQVLYAPTLFFIEQRHVHLKKGLISNFQIELRNSSIDSKVKSSLSVWSGWAEKAGRTIKNPKPPPALSIIALWLYAPLPFHFNSSAFPFMSILGFQADSWTLQTVLWLKSQRDLWRIFWVKFIILSLSESVFTLSAKMRFKILTDARDSSELRSKDSRDTSDCVVLCNKLNSKCKSEWYMCLN